MSVRRVSLRTPEEQAEEDAGPQHSRRSSVTSTNWENARYKRHAGSSTSLSSATQQSGPVIGHPAPLRPHGSKSPISPPIVRPVLKTRTPSSQQMAYHFRNSSTGHLHHTQSYHYRDKNYPPYQHQYRKLASASQTSVIRTSMYGQYGWYNYSSDSRKNSVGSLDLPHASSPDRQHAQRSSVYGQSNASQSHQSLDDPFLQPTFHDRNRDRRSWYKTEHTQGIEISRRATIDTPAPPSSHPPNLFTTNGNNAATAPRRRSTLKKTPPTSHVNAGQPVDQQRPTSSLSTNSSRPLPQEPPTLPPPDLNPGWPPRGWHVYVSAMTQDYLYGGSGAGSAQRPALEDYVFDQDTLTFVRREVDRATSPTTEGGHGTDGTNVRHGDGDEAGGIPQAYAYEPSPGPGPRGRATQSLDIPREHAKFDFPFNAPPVPPLPAEAKKAAALSKKASSKKSGSKSSNKGVAPPDEATTDTTSPTTPNGDAKFALQDQSPVSLSSKKSTRSSKSKKDGGGGWFSWGRKRSKSVNARDGDAHDGGPPPVPTLPENLQLEPLTLDSPHVNGDLANVDQKGGSPAECDVSVKDDWTIQAMETPKETDVGEHVLNGMDSTASDHDGSQGTSQAPTDSDPSISAQVQLDGANEKQPLDLDAEPSHRASSPADRSPYPSPPSSTTGDHPRPSMDTQVAASPASSATVTSTSTPTSPSASPLPSRANTIIAPSSINCRHSRRNSTKMRGGAYILDTLEGTRIASPYPEPQSTVIRRMSQVGANGRSESTVSLASAFSDPTATAPSTARASSVDLHSRPMSALSSITATATMRGSSVDLHSRPMSAFSNVTATATPIASVLSSPMGSSVDLASSRPMSVMSDVTATTTARSYSPFPSFSYAPPGSSTATSGRSSFASSSPYSTPSKSTMGAAYSPSSPYNGYNGNYSSPPASPSPSSPSTTPTQTPTKSKGWRRWTSPLSGSSQKKAASVKGASASKVDLSKSRASVDVRMESPVEYGNGAPVGNANGVSADGTGLGGGGAEGPLVWSAPVKLAPTPSKLRKKRK